MSGAREKRDPLARKRLRHVPPGARSRAMHALSARAAQGRLVMQACSDCDKVTYPPRDACPACWGELGWREQPAGAQVLCETTVRVSTDPYFRDHMPWRMGKVQMDAGPVALVHLHAALHPGDRAHVRAMVDRGGNAALFAIPEGAIDLMSDPQWREFVVPVAGRIALVSDARNAIGRAVVRELQTAGAELVVAGLPGPALASDAYDAVYALDRVQTIALDVTDPVSVAEAASRIGGPLDIVVNTARHVRTGGMSAGNALVEQRRALEVSAMGLSRLAATFAPILAGRPNGAFVDVLSSAALAGDAGNAGFAAAEAARLSLLQAFRHEMRGTGVRVLSVFTGPVDDSDHQHAPPPKVPPVRIAGAIAEALANGREETCVGDVAADAMMRWLADPSLYVREKNL
ncbi:SDR family NAD(P)-dependent oxidoreductase [Novosphingobium cyanobacteriorum]|uniref:SDR family NAD(P)-dependent oxidoreductase n=1 Tax=Novosphingobium cyanobacteriorum TaxID=3024215 RepID=A0ABT6CIJ1_9SPHN|nr:SDR family NAD(P)-dependent oxidoreductase [Novosphingobium cyanobacteriorum]MDF8333749.1 SDR family NAD(P)-dependent oxidoreductase [Novosphingobium cyanobacteriorum]